ncbi:MAG: hypothetical protein MN733_40690 [Nitrososphaera sp.]|nr:hypothetical protein [Nitrososphaera sp.]
MDSSRDRQILVQAMLKSIIESGTPSSEWEAKTREAIIVFARIMKSMEVKSGKE